MSECSTDVIRRVFPEGGEGFLEVGNWADDPSLLELRTVDGEDSKGWFGPVSVTMTAEFATELGNALLAAAKELKK